jgi:hypothetical protein
LQEVFLMFRKLIPFVAVCSLSLLIAACGDDEGNVCRQGDTNCVCAGQDACTWTCEGGGCAFNASNQGTAVFDCNSGGCTLTATAQGDVTLLCSAGNCNVTSAGQSKMTVECAGGGCTMTCNGTGNCIINGCPACTCTEGSITATCTVN